LTIDELTRLLKSLYPSGLPPKPLNLVSALVRVRKGELPKDAARDVGTTAAKVEELVASANPISLLFGVDSGDDAAKRTRQMLGNLIVGRCAEIAFEEIYKKHMHTTELELRDLREGRSDTDYWLHNGKGRPVYRVNIKFHGSLFRRANEMVGLEPEDCFPLATYKIHSALQKQTSDQLPYIFVIVSATDLKADTVGASMPAKLLDFASWVTASTKVSGKRDIEDRIVEHLRREEHSVFKSTLDRIAKADWYVLSARKADKLLHSLLYNRVFALRIRNFARQFQGAELDMHFSLSRDLTPLEVYLTTLRNDGYPKVTTLLERGDY